MRNRPGLKEKVEVAEAPESSSDETPAAAPATRMRAHTVGMPNPAMMMAGLGAAIAQKRQSSAQTLPVSSAATNEEPAAKAAAFAGRAGGMALPGLGAGAVKLQPAGARAGRGRGGTAAPASAETPAEPTNPFAGALRKRTSTVAAGDVPVAASTPSAAEPATTTTTTTTAAAPARRAAGTAAPQMMIPVSGDGASEPPIPEKTYSLAELQDVSSLPAEVAANRDVRQARETKREGERALTYWLCDV